MPQHATGSIRQETRHGLFRPHICRGGRGSLPPAAVSCPLCGSPVAPDPLGFVECPCGWGGKHDPLESAGGLSRMVTRVDRRWAAAQARRDLRRLASRGEAAGTLGIVYVALLVLASTMIYLVVYGLFVGAVALTVYSILDRAWLGLGVGVILVAAIGWELFRPHPSPEGIAATRERFPRLFAALDEVAARVGTRPPQQVVLTPGAECAIGRRHSLRHPLGQHVVSIGVAMLPLLSDVELKSILAHELAHGMHGDTVQYRYSAQAEAHLHGLLDTALEGLSGHTSGAFRAARSYTRSLPGWSLTAFFGAIFSWTLLLPIRVLWVAFHLFRMRESRSAEFEADRTAVLAYGVDSFINALTAIGMSFRTLRHSSGALRASMARHGTGNFYAEMRRHYSELPPQVVATLRVEASNEFRTMERSHPIMPDRLRAAYALRPAAPSPAPTGPAIDLLTPAGAPSADAVEIELTQLLLSPGK